MSYGKTFECLKRVIDTAEKGSGVGEEVVETFEPLDSGSCIDRSEQIWTLVAESLEDLEMFVDSVLGLRWQIGNVGWNMAPQDTNTSKYANVP
ncbi:hypothetical protein HBI56_000630 [Parastagonospora nodorum]|nr:hypothetical protein HBH56_140440 [Parastagonospora nodorum]KAH3928176.1 hypothetical protein HBH54_145580 [Parastagonospora nodorum]KAH3949171.1 hypothetical protein HBH53_095580 [Parastagonospora nodorum]KAH3983491.1 hypothetical protein HBH51_032580 [Parastagonospora nodorum]KAH4005657.1 hypothetical protein HBI10_038110 [Parastagonospora nodorum]